MTNGWNISDVDGEKTLIRLLIRIIDNQDIYIKSIPILLKRESKKLGINITRNEIKRNINNYIKVKYGSIEKLLIKLNHIFHRQGDKIQVSINYKKESEEYEFI